MVATHDSYTYMKPKNPLMNLISLWWRCQKKTIKEQYDLGARIFDIRVYRNNDKWGMAHGFAHFDENFRTISDICEYFKTNFPGSVIRIYLEDNVKKNDDLKEFFLAEADEAFGKYQYMFWEVGTHHPWVTYYRNKEFSPQIKEYYCHLFNWNTDRGFWYNIKNFDWSSWSLPAYAKKHNIPITDEMIQDDKVMHLFDFIGVYPK